MNDDNLLNGINVDSNLQPYTITTTAVDDGSITLIGDSISTGILSGQISTALGQATYGNWWNGNASSITSPSWNDTGISISDSLFDGLRGSLLEIKKDEILNDVEKFCKEKCFFGLEEICDSDIKCECPLWNRLKCEKRV